MEPLVAGMVVLVRFPFSDLSSSKLRPAVLLADVDRDDWILCQITSKPYSDLNPICLTDENFEKGSLQRESFVRPGKLFTANASLFERSVGQLRPEILTQIVGAVVGIVQSSLPNHRYGPRVI